MHPWLVEYNVGYNKAVGRTACERYFAYLTNSYVGLAAKNRGERCGHP